MQVGSVSILAASVASCATGEQTLEITVVGTDYAFQVPRVLPAGRTLFAFENRGRLDHELILARLKPGITLQQALNAQRRGVDSDEITDQGAGILFADPGQTSAGKLLVDLSPGRTYALICLVRDSEQSPPHVAMGMAASFEVESPAKVLAK